MNSTEIFTVTGLNTYVKDYLEQNQSLHGVYVQGEISNYKKYPSGHHYFSLKDNSSTVRCVMYSFNAQRLRFLPDNGMKVTVLGSVSLYPRDGAFQLYATDIIQEGVGQLQLAFEKLKKQLSSEGLFDVSHKKNIPAFPSKIGVVTSGSGAAVRDIVKILRSRWPLSAVFIVPVKVQGVGSAEEIASAIDFLNHDGSCDLIITGRGGGSIEDLWAFNEEIVAKAIYRSSIPVISAVGHEPDVTISDYVADVRASTPSNAAELAVRNMSDIRQSLSKMSDKLDYLLDKKLTSARGKLQQLAARECLSAPENRIQRERQQLDYYSDKLRNAVQVKLDFARKRLAVREASLLVLNPLNTLNRGYSLVLKNGTVIRSKQLLLSGDEVSLILADGNVDCVVK